MRRFSRSSAEYAPATPATDIARLLEPYYAAPPISTTSSPSSSSSSASPVGGYAELQPRAYVDSFGALHDPDYRDFPLLPGRRRSYESERDDVDCEDDDKRTKFLKAQRRAAAARRDQERRRASLPVEAFVEPCRPKMPKLQTWGPAESKEEVAYVEEEEEIPPPHNLRSVFDDDIVEDKSWTTQVPTCGDALRYHYQAFKLKLSFTIHRTRRRWRERRSSVSSSQD